MPDFVLAHPQASALVGGLLLTWLLVLTRRRRIPHGAAVPLTVFCLHCNWEGRVTQAARRCGRCGCSQLTVLSV